MMAPWAFFFGMCLTGAGTWRRGGPGAVMAGVVRHHLQGERVLVDERAVQGLFEPGDLAAHDAPATSADTTGLRTPAMIAAIMSFPAR